MKNDEFVEFLWAGFLMVFIFLVLAITCGRAIDSDQTPDHIRAERAAILEGRQ